MGSPILRRQPAIAANQHPKMFATPAEACARYLKRLGGRSRLVAEPFGLHAGLDASLVDLSAAGSAFLESAQQQLEAIGLSHRFHFGLIERAVEADERASSAQEAYAAVDVFAVAGETPSSFLLFTVPFARDIFLAWDAMLSHPDLFPEVGEPGAEQAVASLIATRPTDPTRAGYARDQSLLTLEFALHHEFYHVAAGHIEAIRDTQRGARLNAVTASMEQRHVDTSLYKVLELDADVMALRHQTMGLLNGKTLLPHACLLSSDPIEGFRHLGRSTTLLFRLIARRQLS